MRIMILFFLIMFIYCGTKIPKRHYYIMDYSTELDTNVSNINQKEFLPFEKKVLFNNFRIPRIYDRKNITIRYSPTEINYLRYHLWAIRPDENITDLVYRHFVNYNIFKEIKYDYYEVIPDLVIYGDIIKLERYYYDGDYTSNYSGSLQMKFQLQDFHTGEVLVTHEFNRTKDMRTKDMNTYIYQLSMILKEETNNFIEKIIDKRKIIQKNQKND